jgi:hypothetical protein
VAKADGEAGLGGMVKALGCVTTIFRQVLPSPEYPALQVQEKVPGPVLEQLAFLSHGSEAQASISRQVLPLPEYPALQVQEKVPGPVLEQLAFLSHGSEAQALISTQVLPSPEYPALQVQEKAVGPVRVQIAFLSHELGAQASAASAPAGTSNRTANGSMTAIKRIIAALPPVARACMDAGLIKGARVLRSMQAHTNQLNRGFMVILGRPRAKTEID